MNYSVVGLIATAILARIGFFLFGIYQDTYLPVKYTDIDYLVFSDAAHYFVQGGSPYQRETYRYTPLLAWMLSPNEYWPSFGKFLFMVCDVLTGVIILLLLKAKAISPKKRIILSSLWLLNPMVITISTRGSSESILTVFIMLATYFKGKGSIFWSAVFLGVSIHFKIYPIIYIPAFMLSIKGRPLSRIPPLNLLNWNSIKFAMITMITSSLLSMIMYHIYGYEFLYNAYLYHLSRLDHRHNFSVYNVALYFKSAFPFASLFPTKSDQYSVIDSMEKLAFLPQFLVSTIVLPLIYAGTDLESCLFLQTFAFVMFNKVITSQYFIWFLIFLPHYLARLLILTQRKNRITGMVVLAAWVITQGAWLYFAYKLEFLGESTFTTGLLASSSIFYLANCWILGVFMDCF